MRYAVSGSFRSAEREAVGWSMPAALVVLGIATVATAFVSETLVGTLQAFADMAHLSDFFVAAVIVAVLGNATEHGSAVLLARRGRVKLATEIPLASSAQIAGLVIPLVALISWGFTPLALGFRPVELAAMAVAAALPAFVLRTGRTSRVGGAILLAAYSAFAVAAYLSGDGLRVRISSTFPGLSSVTFTEYAYLSLLQDRIVGNALAQDSGDEPGSASSSIVRPLKLPPAFSTSPTGSTRRPCASSGLIVGSQFLEIFCWFLVT